MYGPTPERENFVGTAPKGLFIAAHAVARTNTSFAGELSQEEGSRELYVVREARNLQNHTLQRADRRSGAPVYRRTCGADCGVTYV